MKNPNNKNAEWRKVRENFYINFFGPLDEKIMHSTDIKDVHIDIYKFPPYKERDYWTLITGGMSDLPQDIPEDIEGISSRTEIILYAYEPQIWMFKVLKGLAEMPFDDKTYLHWFHTVPNGKPMTTEDSDLTSYFFLPPYFEEIELNDFYLEQNKVDILWMIPITENERKFAMKNGSKALEELFEKNELNPVIDEKRKSLV